MHVQRRYCRRASCAVVTNQVATPCRRVAWRRPAWRPVHRRQLEVEVALRRQRAIISSDRWTRLWSGRARNVDRFSRPTQTSTTQTSARSSASSNLYPVTYQANLLSRLNSKYPKQIIPSHWLQEIFLKYFQMLKVKSREIWAIKAVEFLDIFGNIGAIWG